ncbi:MAG TPA: FtsX-like permease family protein [Jatrophihabitantaceae bacterium]
MRTVSLRNLAAHKVRLILTVVSVLLGTAFVAGSLVFTDTLQHTFSNIFTDADKGIDARVQPYKSYDPGVPTAVVQQIKALPGVRVVQPVAQSSIVLVGANGKRVDTGGAPSVGGIWTPPDESVRPADGFASGGPPTAPGQVAINLGAAKKANLHAGEHTKVVLPNAGVVPVTISGIYRTNTETGGYIGVLFGEQQALQLLTDGSHLAAVDVAADKGVSQRDLTARIARILPSDLQAKTGDQVRKDDQTSVQRALSFVTYFLLAFGVIALIVGTFIIYNTFSMIVAQRLRELALLRAIGAGRKQIRRSVVFEAGVIGLIGSAAGLAGGIGLAYGLRAILDALNAGLPAGGLVLSIRTVIVALLLGTGVTMISAYAPARRASRIAPVAAMREEFATPAASSLRRRTLIGALVGAVGAVATVGGALSSSGGTGASLVGLGLLGVAAGVMLASPLLARWVIVPIGRVLGSPFGTVGTLARNNAVRNPRRTAATSFALTLGLLLVSGVAVIGASMKTSINSLFDNHVTADYMLTTQVDVNVPIKAAAAVRNVAGVATLTEIHGLTALVDGSRNDSGSAIDGPLAPVFAVHSQRGAAEPAGTGLVVSQASSKRAGWAMGSKHTMTTHNGQMVTLTVTGIYANDNLLGPWMVTGEVYRTLVPSNDWSDEVALVKAAPGTDLNTLRANIARITDPYYVINVQNRSEFKGSLASQVNGLLGLLYGLLGLAIVIAILGIVNTLALSVIERRREIGILRAVGMQRKQVRRTIYVESLLIAVFGAVLGLALGLTYGVLFTRTLRGQGLDHVSVPWNQAVIFLVVAAIVGVLAALWPGARAARTPPLEAISTS